MNIKAKAAYLKTYLPALFLAMKKKETPLIAKIIAGITVCYALSPIDLIPDFIPVLGYLDDLIILPLLVALTIRLIPKNVFEACKKESIDLWKNSKPKKWYFGIPIIIIWFFIIAVLAWNLI